MLQSAACKFIATNLTLENEVKEITQLFQKLEHSLNGKISIKDLVKGRNGQTDLIKLYERNEKCDVDICSRHEARRAL